MAARAKVGVIAGGGEIPGRLIEACRAQGREVFVLALEGQADPDQFAIVPDAWIRLGEAGRGLKLLRGAEARELVFVGQVRRPSLAELLPDGWTAKFLARIGKAYFGDDSLLSALARTLEAEGFAIVAPESLFEGLLVEERAYGDLRPDPQAQADIERGVAVARAIGALDIGQGAIVQQGTVLTVEAAEGTDAMIARSTALRLDGPGGVLVKMCKPGQERRIDLPTVGPATVAVAAAAGLRGIAVEAGRALVVDADAVARAADAAGLFVVGVVVRE
jgi:DUF1009 family protein